MIPIKTTDELKIMEEGGRKLSQVLDQIIKMVKPGINLEDLDKMAEILIKKQKGRPSFKMVKNYHWTTCLNVNQGVVHGVPFFYRLKENDILSIDIGMFYKGFHTDMARTIIVKRKKNNQKLKDEFLLIGKKALEKAISVARPGKRIGHISRAIEITIKKGGYQPITTLTGHGVGRKLHEPPQIPCYLEGKIEETAELKPGMTLAIEVIYTQGDPDVKIREKNGWTVETVDGKISALFEDTIAIIPNGSLILTRLNDLESEDFFW